MSTSFTSLPIVDLAPLTSELASDDELAALSTRLYEVFSTVGFAYLINVPLSLTHEDVFGTAREFFSLPEDVKMQVAKRTFKRANSNTYRGYVHLKLALF
jgi:isopenicillin N synthase-like dioxygenase